MQVGVSLGYFISSIFSDVITAGIATIFVVMPSLLFGGLLVNLTTLFWWIRWISWTSPTRFAFEALLWAQWSDD